jgi:hypothetical protein
MTKMRAKMVLSSVTQYQGSEKYEFNCVGSDKYGPNGESEDNTFARYSPSGTLSINVTNPDLLGKFKPGQKFYIDFTESQL